MISGRVSEDIGISLACRSCCEPDLVWRDGRFTGNRKANRDPDFRNQTRVSDEHFDRLVRNVYKVLLTRGMIGTVLYSTDAETHDALRTLVS